jgi:hypothetical protein
MAQQQAYCGSPSSTIEAPVFRGNYPITDCIGATLPPNDERVFVVKGWAPSKDIHGRNVHTYIFDKIHPCDPCYGTDNGTVDDMFIVSCEPEGQCFPGTAVAREKTRIRLKKRN